ncbi:hypothetical protein BMS3Abin13_00982 [bacterium BMS3Abin13]|nr:hypothetical protein BMS3Abin13_00982 [bacterium BMS3Abin13]
MRCRKVISYLNAYADGELPEELRLVVKDHIAVCKTCRGRLEEIQGIDVLFQGTLSVPPVPDGLAARIMAEARRRQSVVAPKRSEWNPLQWIAGLSAPMRIAACATVLLAFVAGLSLDGGWMSGQGSSEPEKNLSGLEWFDPAPPGSIGSIYIAMTTQTYQEGTGR